RALAALDAEVGLPDRDLLRKVAFFKFGSADRIGAVSRKFADLEDLGKRGASITKAKTDKSFAWRELVWEASYAKFKKHPILGVGTGKLIYVQTQGYQDYIESRNIHNSFLAVMLQTGLLGLGVLVFFIYKNMRNLVKSFKKKKNQFYALSILGILIIYIISSLFQPYLETNLLAIFFWIALGLSRNLTNLRTYENFRNQ
ncbi:MAG TPA: O-antigen ligase family protein, partial [Candidatus Portnoybacteria bacterium]|nr:O-antigen ligase family protein [Candidatus Portnoybacteria bacterium]